MLKDKSGKVLSRSEGEAVMKGRAAVTVTVLAAILAIITLIANSNSSRVTTANIQANDIYAFYQAKSIKQSLYQMAADDLEMVLEDKNLAAGPRDQLNANHHQCYHILQLIQQVVAWLLIQHYTILVLLNLFYHFHLRHLPHTSDAGENVYPRFSNYVNRPL